MYEKGAHMVHALLSDDTKIKLPIWLSLFSNRTDWKNDSSKNELIEKLSSMLKREQKVILLINDKPVEVSIDDNNELVVKELEHSTYEY